VHSVLPFRAYSGGIAWPLPDRRFNPCTGRLGNQTVAGARVVLAASTHSLASRLPEPGKVPSTTPCPVSGALPAYVVAIP